MKGSRLIIFLFLLISAVFAEDEPVFDGECPKDVPTVKDFDYSKFSEVWYEIKRFPNSIVSEQCAMVKYTLLEYNNYNVTYLSRNIEKKATTKRQLVYDKEIIQSPNIKYDIYFKCKKEDFQYLVLDTDYETYSVVWGCVNKEEKNTQRLFIYSRTKTLDDKVFQQINHILNGYGIDHNKLKDVEQIHKECDNILKDPPIWNGCPSETCSEAECTVNSD